MKVWHLLLIIVLGAVGVVTRPDRWLRAGIAHGIVRLTSGGSVDSLERENASLKNRMVQFERISAEKDTLLTELRDAHLLIEGVATELRHFDGRPEDSVRVVEAANDEAPAPSYREVMIQRLEGVRHRLAELEDTSRVRGERLAAMA